MFNYTYDQLLERALSHVNSGMNTSEGSFLYDAITSCVQELYMAYMYCDEMEKRLYADTAYDEFLDRRCAERGIIRNKAVASQRFIAFTLIDDSLISNLIGTKWGKEDVIYTVKSVYSGNVCIAICDTTGIVGNKYSGEMINIDATENVTDAELGEIVVAGAEVENDEDLRQRYFESFNNMAFGGNIADYKQKVGAIEGVGQVKVYPVYYGPGTVLVRILGNDGTIPNQALIEKVQNEINPKNKTGVGLGLAPIGHDVTILGAVNVNVTIKCKFTYKNGYSYDSLKSQIEESIGKYIKSLKDDWSTEDNLIIRSSQIESKLLDIIGIIDVTETQINDVQGNLTLNSEEIPQLAAVMAI